MVLTVNKLNTSIGSKHILHNISFEVQPGEIIGLIGKNGSGKTTIMKSVISLIKFQSGTVTMNDTAIDMDHHAGLADIRALIEYPALYDNMNGRQHLKLYAMGENITTAMMDEIITETGIAAFIDQKTKGYSLGMRQRLAIAITLLAQPKLVILDEPMNGLDPESTHEMRTLIVKLAKERGISFLISSHLLDELSRMADRFVIIDQGTVIKTGTLEEVTSKNKSQVVLQTTDNAATETALLAMNYHVLDTPQGLNIALHGTSLNNLLHDLVAINGIDIVHLSETSPDLESSFLDLLDEQTEAAHE